MMLWILLAVMTLTSASSSSSTVEVHIEDDRVYREISEKFMSFTMDAGSNARFDEFSTNVWNNERMRTLARHLSPAKFRFGGTEEDYTWYGDGNIEPPNRVRLNYTMFESILNFSVSANFDFIFGVNAISQRTENNEWNYTNFQDFLSEMPKDRLRDVHGFELSNEPDLKCVAFENDFYDCNRPPSNVSKPKYVVEPKQLGHDFQTLENVLEKVYDSNHPSILGPDVAGHYLTYGKNFLGNLTTSKPIEFTWHFYYGPGTGRDHPLGLANFSQPKVLDRFMSSANETLSLLSDPSLPITDILVGETSSTYGGGTSNTSASFAAGFMWLDKLGLASVMNQSYVCRQTFASARYSLIGPDGVLNPDYWTSVLFRQLIGTSVLRVRSGLDPERSFRTYAFCSQSGDIAVAFLNTNDVETTSNITFLTQQTIKSIKAYVLTSEPGNLASRNVYLNGHILRLKDDADGTLPDLSSMAVEYHDTSVFVAPPKSYGFLILSLDDGGICNNLIK